MHHMTANWCPVAREERNQLCFGVWGTVGSTGRWPEVVNMWELDGWDGLAAQLRARVHPRHAAGPVAGRVVGGRAASLRRGGVDRIVVPEPWTRPIDELIADGVRGEVYAHELVKRAGRDGRSSSAASHEVGRAGAREPRRRDVGAFRVAMVNDSECIVHLGASRLGHVGCGRAGVAGIRSPRPVAHDLHRSGRPLAAIALGGGPAQSHAPVVSPKSKTACHSTSSDRQRRPPSGTKKDSATPTSVNGAP